MAIQTKDVLKSYFETGDIPSQSNFEDLIDSLSSILNAGTGITLTQNDDGSVTISSAGGSDDAVKTSVSEGANSRTINNEAASFQVNISDGDQAESIQLKYSSTGLQLSTDAVESNTQMDPSGFTSYENSNLSVRSRVSYNTLTFWPKTDDTWRGNIYFGKAPHHGTMESMYLYDGSDSSQYIVEGIVGGNGHFSTNSPQYKYWGLGINQNQSEGTHNYMLGFYNWITGSSTGSYIGGMPIYRHSVISGNSATIYPGDILQMNITASAYIDLGALDYDGGIIGWQAGGVATLTVRGKYNTYFNDPEGSSPSSYILYGAGYDSVNPTAMQDNECCVYTIAYDGGSWLVNRQIYWHQQ